MFFLTEVETIRKIRGKASKGIKNNPKRVKSKDRSKKVKQVQDSTIEAEYEEFWQKVRDGYDPFNTGIKWDSKTDNGTNEDEDKPDEKGGAKNGM